MTNIVDGLTAAVAGQIDLGMWLARVRRSSQSVRSIDSFTRGAQTFVVHDIVVLCDSVQCPAVELDAA
jgi:hypothetical protein